MINEIPPTNLMFKGVGKEMKLYVSYSQIETFQQCPYKWYKTYVEGLRSTEKQEATSYGTVIHEVLEYFFKNWRKPNVVDLSDMYNYAAAEEEIPFETVESGLKATRDAGLMIQWLAELFEKDMYGDYMRKKEDLNAFETLLRYSSTIGTEERFELPYRLKTPLTYNGVTYNEVVINGSIDLHLGIRKDGRMHHYVIDWKSGKKVFDNSKLKHNLQHPIYAFYIMRKYGEGLPDAGLYYFTRLNEFQVVKVDRERVRQSVEVLDDCFSKMYNFKDKTVEKFYMYEEIEADGETKFRFRTARPRNPIPENMKPCPSALCYYCDFGKHKKNLCPYSSNWDPSKKKNKE